MVIIIPKVPKTIANIHTQKKVAWSNSKNKFFVLFLSFCMLLHPNNFLISYSYSKMMIPITQSICRKIAFNMQSFKDTFLKH